MYSLDVNFLNDRQERPSEAGLARPRGQRQSSLPLYLGLAAMIALPALVIGFWLLLQSQNRQLAQQQAELDSQLTALNAQLDVINTINTQVSEIEAENQALATVFDRIKPWSAVLQDIRGRVPNGVQISQIQQVEGEAQAQAAATPSPSPSPTEGEAQAPAAAPEPPPSQVNITGFARSFNDVNDFVLTLKRSPFLNAEEVRLVTSELVDNPTSVEFANEQTGGEIEVELPRVVEYTIQASLTNLPASELLQDLERTLSVGLATRIQALRDRGVIQP
ncbi:MAG: PilN domain-containing protein [Elainellaceae cyanobacterium]